MHSPRLSWFFDSVPILSLVFLRIAWGIFGYYTNKENPAVLNLLEEMTNKEAGVNWDGLRAVIPYQNFGWLFDIYVYLYSNYPVFMILNFRNICYYGLSYSALAYSFGFLSPISGPLYCFFFNLTFFGKGEVRFVNHYYMKGLIILLLITTKAGGSYSIDSILKGIWKKLKGEKNINYFGKQTCPRWNITIIQLQVIVVFLFATSTKIQEDWLRGQPWEDYFEIGYRSRPITRFVLDFVFNSHPKGTRYLALFVSYGGIFYDGIIIPVLLTLFNRPLNWRKNKQSLYVFIFGIGSSVLFHTSNAYITQHIGQFPRMTLVLYTMFLQYDWPKLLLQWIYYMIQQFGLIPIYGELDEIKKDLGIDTVKQKHYPNKKKHTFNSKTRKDHNKDNTTTKLSFFQWMVILFIIIWFTVQIMIPTRHIWIGTPHRSLWSSYGTYFNWRMMMVTCEIYKAELEINHPVSNRTMIVVPLKQFHMADTLTLMTNEHWERIDYVVSVAHHIADTIEEQKGERPKYMEL